MFSETTNYSIVNEFNVKSTISISKFTADFLQMHMTDVHNWIQFKYDLILDKMPNKTRRYRGNILRLLAERDSQNHPLYNEYIKLYF